MDAKTDPFVEIAEFIAGKEKVDGEWRQKPPPPNLADKLRRHADTVRAFHESERKALRRTDAMQRLGDIADAAQRLIDELGEPLDPHEPRDPLMATFLAQAGPTPLAPDAETIVAILTDLRQRALSAKAAQEGGGPARATPQHRGGPPLEARRLAAFVIAEAWRLCHGSRPEGYDSRPKVKGEETAEAADMLWRAATGSGASGWSHYLTGLDAIRAADDPRGAFLSEVRAAFRTP